MRSEKTKLDSLRSLIQTVVKNTKVGKTSATEARQMQIVAEDLVGRELTNVELDALFA